jgi:hypothetical protein
LSLQLSAGDTPESKSGRVFEVVNIYVVLGNKKGDSRFWLSPKNGRKKGKRTPYQSEALLPVIFLIIIMLAIYPAKVRFPLFNQGVF